MNFPKCMSEQDLMDFEFELNRIIDTERGEGQFWAENAECQMFADEQRAAFLAIQHAEFFGA